MISWSVLLILNGAVTFQVTTELRYNFRDHPRPNDGQTKHCSSWHLSLSVFMNLGFEACFSSQSNKIKIQVAKYITNHNECRDLEMKSPIFTEDVSYLDFTLGCTLIGHYCVISGYWDFFCFSVLSYKLGEQQSLN